MDSKFTKIIEEINAAAIAALENVDPDLFNDEYFANDMELFARNLGYDLDRMIRQGKERRSPEYLERQRIAASLPAEEPYDCSWFEKLVAALEDRKAKKQPVSFTYGRSTYSALVIDFNVKNVLVEIVQPLGTVIKGSFKVGTKIRVPYDLLQQGLKK